MAWAKVHTDILGDPKLMRAARSGARGLQLVPWLIIFAKQANDHGRLSVGASAVEPADLLALIPNTTLREIAACLDACTALGVLVADPDQVLRFAKWGPRQGKPSDTPERVRDRVTSFRNRQRETPLGGVTVTPEPRVTVTRTEETEQKRRDRSDRTGPKSGDQQLPVTPEEFERRREAAKAELLASRGAVEAAS